jgi:hypothetical protein
MNKGGARSSGKVTHSWSFASRTSTYSTGQKRVAWWKRQDTLVRWYIHSGDPGIRLPWLT